MPEPLAATSHLPSGLKAMLSTPPIGTAMSGPPSTRWARISHRHTLRPWPVPSANSEPVGLNATPQHRQREVLPDTGSRLRLCTSQRQSPSSQAAASVLPSGLNATPRVPFVAPANGGSARVAEARVQRVTLESSLPEATVLPSGLHATPQMAALVVSFARARVRAWRRPEDGRRHGRRRRPASCRWGRTPGCLPRCGCRCRRTTARVSCDAATFQSSIPVRRRSQDCVVAAERQTPHCPGVAYRRGSALVGTRHVPQLNAAVITPRGEHRAGLVKRHAAHGTV